MKHIGSYGDRGGLVEAFQRFGHLLDLSRTPCRRAGRARTLHLVDFGGLFGRSPHIQWCK